MSKNEVAKPSGAALPAHLQGGKKSSVGNIDSSDLIIPRVKLLQKISTEPDEYDNAKAGEFWHTIANQSLGAKLVGIPILIKKSYVLWSPRNDDRGILARSSDGINWDAGMANLDFEVKPKGSPHSVKYNTGDNVAASGLAEFGSSIPGDSNSPPAASLTYNMLWYFPDFPDFSPAVIINTRSSVKTAKALLSKIEMRPVDHYGQRYIIGITDEKGDEGPYHGYSYTADGYVEDEAVFAETRGLYERFKETSWQPSDATDDQQSDGGAVGGGDGKRAAGDKF